MSVCVFFKVASSKQTIALLKQDKEYLTRQVSDLNNKLTFNEERQQQLSRQVDDAKLSREEMYEKYVASRYFRLSCIHCQ